jgi:hypothetical protein
VRLGCPCRRECMWMHVRLGAHGCRGVSGSNLGLDLAAKWRGNADRGGPVRTITSESVGVRTSHWPNVRATGKPMGVQERGLGPLPVGSGPSQPRWSSGRRQWWRRPRFSRPGTDTCGCVRKPVARRALNDHKDSASLPCSLVHEVNPHAEGHGGAASRGATSR